MQMVVTKPISRWQIWLGKWLGILGLNAALLGVSGAAIFFLLTNRASHLPPDQQRILRQDIFVARASLKQPPPNYGEEADKAMQEALKLNNIPENQIPEVRKMFLDRIKNGSEIVPPGYMKRWTIDVGMLKDFIKDKTLQLRVRFRTSRYNDGQTYKTLWLIGDPDSPTSERIPQILPPESFQEFTIPNLIGPDGKLIIDVANPPDNPVDLLFDANDGLEVLYAESTFAVNFGRGLAIIFCWLTLLATIGLAAGSLLSFPVAAFFSIAVLIVGFSGGTLSAAVESRTPISSFIEHSGVQNPTFLDNAVAGLLNGVLKIVKLVQAFSPIDALSAGRSITWLELGTAVAQIVVLMGGIFIALGITFFTRRELAAVQATS